MEVLNGVQAIFSFEIFIQGFIFTICISLGLFLLLSDQRSEFSNNETFLEYINKLRKLVGRFIDNLTFSNSLQKKEGDSAKSNVDIKYLVSVKSVSLLIGVLIFTAIFGLIINSISDKWMDKNNRYHLGLKALWAHTKYYSSEGFEDLDEKIKVATFYKIFKHNEYKEVKNFKSKDALSNKYNILQFYYSAKHSIMTKTEWSGYLSYTQYLISCLQGISFSFFNLFILCYINFSINICRNFFSDKYSAKAFFLPIIYCLGFFIALEFIFTDKAQIAIVLSLPIIIQSGIKFYNSFVSVLNKNSNEKYNIYYSLTSVIIIYFSFVFYLLSSIAWIQNEEIYCSKVYGIYKYENLKEIDENWFNEYINGTD